MKTATKLKNTATLAGKAGLGSVTNWMMGNNNTVPVVGEGATELSWTDRTAYDVVSVSADGKQCIIRRCKAIRTDDRDYFTESQNYRYEADLNGQQKELVYRHGAWKEVNKHILFTEEARALPPQEREKYYRDSAELTEVVEGITYLKKTYTKIHMIFGRRDEYVDPSF